MAETTPGTRDRLLEAARELFTTAGYHATTTPVLARRAGVAEGTIYRHFPSKHALLNAAFLDVQEWGLTTARRQLSATGPAAQRLRSLGLEWLDAAASDPARMRMLLGWRVPGELEEASVNASRALHHAIEGLLAHGKQEGTVRSGVVELWATVWLRLVSLAVEQVTSGEWGARHPHATSVLDAAWEAIAWRPIAMPAVSPVVQSSDSSEG